MDFRATAIVTKAQVLVLRWVGRAGWAGVVVGWGGWGWVWECTHVMHGRSRNTVDARTPSMSGLNTWGYHRLGRQCLHQAPSVVGCSARRMNRELHPTKTRF